MQSVRPSFFTAASRLLRTASFRLAASYLAVFSLSVMLLGAAVYVSVRHALLHEIDERVGEETALLVKVFDSGGLDALVATIERRSAGVASLDYRVEDAAGLKLTGSLPSPQGAKTGATWTELTAIDDDTGDGIGIETVRALATRLRGGALLVVGDDLGSVASATRAVTVAFGWALALMILLGVAGGLLLSAAFLRRIDAMARTARAIIAGNLHQRIPNPSPHDDLGRLAATFNRMLDRIEALIETNRQVTNDIAHDLRSPLARMLRRLEGARLQPGRPGAHEAAIDSAIAEINGIIETFNALLRIGQIETGARRGGFTTIDLAAIVGEVAEAFAPAAGEEGRPFEIAPGAPLFLQGDRELLRQLVANLLDNAMRHTPPGTPIGIATQGEAGAAVITVRDGGPGVPEADRSRVFERFYRVDRARMTPGNGLGLSLVAAIAELHGGRVTLGDAAPGLVVSIWLPLAGEAS